MPDRQPTPDADSSPLGASPFPRGTVASKGAAVDLATEIERLRQAAISLAPLEESIDRLSALRGDGPMPATDAIADPTTATLEELSELEAKRSRAPESEPELQPVARKISERLHLRVARLKSRFWQFVYPGTLPAALPWSVAERVCDPWRQEILKAQLTEIERLAQQLDDKEWFFAELDLFGAEVQATIGILIEIEKLQNYARAILAEERQQQRRATALAAIVPIATSGAIAFAIWLGGIGPFTGQVSLQEQRLLPFGTPWPVLVWSFAGSAASVTYRLANQPVGSFGDTLKWLLLRPLQGILFGAALYLFLSGALAALAVETASATADRVVLVLAFLVGFSDRLAAAAFGFFSSPDR